MWLTLTHSDVCDRCPARAYAVAVFEAERLVFCGHHFRKHERALRVQSTRVVDLTDEIPK